jgi:hypothetical protein
MGMKAPAAENGLGCERHQHRMFDIVIERIAVADAFHRGASRALDDTGRTLIVPATHELAEEVLEGFSR